jgi:hypothetical protein
VCRSCKCCRNWPQHPSSIKTVRPARAGANCKAGIINLGRVTRGTTVTAGELASTSHPLSHHSPFCAVRCSSLCVVCQSREHPPPDALMRTPPSAVHLACTNFDVALAFVHAADMIESSVDNMPNDKISRREIAQATFALHQCCQ